MYYYFLATEPVCVIRIFGWSDGGGPQGERGCKYLSVENFGLLGRGTKHTVNLVAGELIRVLRVPGAEERARYRRESDEGTCCDFVRGC